MKVCIGLAARECPPREGLQSFAKRGLGPVHASTLKFVLAPGSTCGDGFEVEMAR